MRSLLGVNIPYFFGSYAHDLAKNPRFLDWPCDFDAMRVSGPLLEAKHLGLDAVRIWLCEGAEGVVTNAQGHVTGVRPEILEAVRVLEEAGHRSGVRIYWGLLDANRDKGCWVGHFITFLTRRVWINPMIISDRDIWLKCSKNSSDW